jgi:hypothetical protein
VSTITNEPFDGYNKPAEPMDPADLERFMRDMYGRAAPYGAPEFSWWRRPPRRVNLSRLRGEQSRQTESSAWREAARSAWIEAVRERLQSAVYAASNGFGWSWTAPGVLGVPGQPESLQVRDARQLWRPVDPEESC